MTTRQQDASYGGWVESRSRSRVPVELNDFAVAAAAAAAAVQGGGDGDESVDGTVAVAAIDDSRTSATTASSLLRLDKSVCWLWTKKLLVLTWLLTSLVALFAFASVALVVVYETDFQWAVEVRAWPELVFIRRHLYIPLRNLFPFLP